MPDTFAPELYKQTRRHPPSAAAAIRGRLPSLPSYLLSYLPSPSLLKPFFFLKKKREFSSFLFFFFRERKKNKPPPRSSVSLFRLFLSLSITLSRFSSSSHPLPPLAPSKHLNKRAPHPSPERNDIHFLGGQTLKEKNLPPLFLKKIFFFLLLSPEPPFLPPPLSSITTTSASASTGSASDRPRWRLVRCPLARGDRGEGPPCRRRRAA